MKRMWAAVGRVVMTQSAQIWLKDCEQLFKLAKSQSAGTSPILGALSLKLIELKGQTAKITWCSTPQVDFTNATRMLNLEDRSLLQVLCHSVLGQKGCLERMVCVKPHPREFQDQGFRLCGRVTGWRTYVLTKWPYKCESPGCYFFHILH